MLLIEEYDGVVSREQMDVINYLILKINSIMKYTDKVRVCKDTNPWVLVILGAICKVVQYLIIQNNIHY